MTGAGIQALSVSDGIYAQLDPPAYAGGLYGSQKCKPEA
jgi:hypothetical protein